MQRWHFTQHESIPDLKSEPGVLTPKPKRVIHIFE